MLVKDKEATKVKRSYKYESASSMPCGSVQYMIYNFRQIYVHLFEVVTKPTLIADEVKAACILFLLFDHYYTTKYSSLPAFISIIST